MADKIKEDLEQVGHDIKNRVTGHDDHDDVKKKLSHEDKAENFTASEGITSDGAFVAFQICIGVAPRKRRPRVSQTRRAA